MNSFLPVVPRCRYGILFVLLVLLVSPNRAETTTETCTDNGNTTCAAEFKTCVLLNTTGDTPLIEEKCDQCAIGYIHLFKNYSICQSVESITLEAYEDAFAPDYSGEQNVQRLVILKAAAQFVSEHNAQFPPPDFLLELNKISAFSEAEHKKRNGYSYNASREIEHPIAWFLASTRRLETLPDAIDWVAEGAVTSVKDQGQCGCCWSISTIGAVEGLAAIDSGGAFRESLSFQQLISCDTTSYGCDGGYVTTAMQYVQANSFGGVTSDGAYPFVDYAGTTSTSCLLSGDNVTVETNSTYSVLTYTVPSTFDDRVTNMKTALAKQPVSIVMNANCNLFYNYKSGVMTTDGSCACINQFCLDHAILMVGYNDTAPIPYWNIKNSWGTGWGEEGYFRVAQTGGGQYGLFGVLAQGTIPGGAKNVTGVTPPETSGAAATYECSSIQFAGTMVVGIIASLIL